MSYGNLVFIAGIGAHFEGDIKAHTKHVLDEIAEALESAGSSMDKVLKVNVYLNDLKDYAGMNEVVSRPLRREPACGRRLRRPAEFLGFARRDRLHRLYLVCGASAACWRIEKGSEVVWLVMCSVTQSKTSMSNGWPMWFPARSSSAVSNHELIRAGCPGRTRSKAPLGFLKRHSP